MSKKTSGKSGTSSVPEPIVIVPITPAPAGIDSSSLPFPEWSDQDVNSEKWDLPKTKDPAAPTQYVDQQPIELPFSIASNLHEWKRPAQLFPDAELVIFNEVSEYPDLISESKHLLHSDFMRSFISAINILEYLGNVQPSPMESATATFTPNTEDSPWRPWHHIYSMTKAGKGQTHNPKVNNIGKYVVRLHWMGAWRKILVDDRLPVDATNHVLLPKLQKKIVELWPFLLCKALLKVACLTWTNKEELRDFTIIYCLTGWVVHKIDTRGMDPEDVWEMCTGFADHYAWPEPGGDKRKKDNKFLKGKDKKKGKNQPNFLDEEEESGIIPCHVLGSFTNMRDIAEDLLPDITPCWGHIFLMAQTRDIPVNKPPSKPELEHWKKFRWLAWAIRNGLWPFDESMIPIKCVRLVSNFRKCADFVVYKPPSKESANIQKSAAIVDEVVSKTGKKGKDKDKGKGKTPDKKDSKKDKSSKSSKDKGKKAKPVPLPPDPSIWVEFEKIAGFIEFLYIFMKPTQFKTYIKVSDVAQPVATGKGKAEKGKKGKDGQGAGQKQQIITNSNILLESRNEPLYLFMDTLDYKFFVINMCQVGNRDILDKIVEENVEEPEEPQKEPKEIFNLLELMRKIKSTRPEIICPDRKETITTTTIEEEEVETEKQPVPFSHLVLEQFNWQSNKIDEMVTFLNTYGTKGTFTNIKRGRFVARLWIKSDTPYVINILSDAPIVMGCLELVLESMTLESHRTVKMCNDISGAYGQLVQKFGTDDYPEGLRNFYSSYKPERNLKKPDLQKIHETFHEEFFNLLSEYFPVNDYDKYIFAFRVLFINPFIKYRQKEKIDKLDLDHVSEIPLIDKMSFCSGEILILKEIERAAMTLQAFFKRLYVKKLQSLHKQTDSRYLGIFDMLKKFYSTILNVNTRLPVVSNFLRRWFFYNPTMREIRSYYDVYEDLQSTVILQHFTGTIFAPSTSWVPICRYVFHCNTPDSIKIKICLFCELSKFVVRVIDNDNKSEIERFTNNVNVASYNNNANGYTVLCYGWTDSVQKISWKLTFVTLKQKKETLLIIPDVVMSKDAIVDTYKPNVYNKICRCLFKIQQDTLATFRLSVSYENAKVHLKCTRENGQLVAEIYGKESVILSALLLEFVPVVNDEMSLTSTGSKILKKRRSKNKSRSSSLSRSHSTAVLKKTMSDITSVRSSVISLKREKRSNSARGSRIDSKSSIFKDTVYVIEGFVGAETWPLTMNEWNIVEIYKQKKLLGLEYVMSLFRSASQSVRSSSERFFPRRSTESKRSSKKSGSLVTLEKPFWNLTVLLNKDDQVAFLQDTAREEEVKKLKVSWYSQDPERYLKSQELRKEYLESHYIRPEPSYDVDMSGERTSTSTSHSEFRQLSKIDRISKSLSKNLSQAEEMRRSSFLRKASHSTVGDSNISLKHYPSFENIRYIKKPEPENETLPPFDLERYQYTVIMTDDEFDDRKLKTEADELIEIEKREKAVENFKLYQETFVEDMTKVLYDQIDSANLLDYWYQCCREKSEELITEGFEEIDDYINKYVEEELRKLQEAKEAAAAAKAGKKDKKKGKK